MGLRKFFSRNKEADEEYKEYRLDDMKIGFLVDHDLKTWQVRGESTYDYDGYLTAEWELHSDSDVFFLEQAVEDGEAEWTFTRRISTDDIDEDVVAETISKEEPPEEIHFGGMIYKADETSAGIQRVANEDTEREFVTWSYESDEGRVLFLNQWGEREFTAYEGTYVEEYQFTDILPGGSGES